MLSVAVKSTGSASSSLRTNGFQFSQIVEIKSDRLFVRCHHGRAVAFYRAQGGMYHFSERLILWPPGVHPALWLEVQYRQKVREIDTIRW